MKKLVFLANLLLISGILVAQDTLPNFSLKNIGNNRIIVGWTNNFQDVRQISIQRSFDSLKNFRTILSVADPSTPQNGYVDTKAATDHMFYRLYIQLDKGVYLFSPSMRPVKDTVVISTPGVLEEPKYPAFLKPGSNGTMQVVIPGMDSASGFVINNPARPKAEVYTPSKYVYAFADGYIRISLPEKEGAKYKVRFYTMDDHFLFELKDLPEREFKIDKTNFYKSGWFRFELFENGELLEKHRFFLPREF